MFKSNLENLFPSVDVHTVHDYFKLPKQAREKWGFYLKPIGLPWNPHTKVDEGWELFSKEIRKVYPIQGFIREYLLSYDNPAYAWFGIKRQQLQEYCWKIRKLFKPDCPRLRAAYKRTEYKDIRTLIVDLNFALIKDFWHEEVSKGYVDWNATVEHKAFYEWLESAITYIEVERPKIELLEEEGIKNPPTGPNCLPLYLNAERAEATRIEKDSRVLQEMITHRHFFWT